MLMHDAEWYIIILYTLGVVFMQVRNLCQFAKITHHKIYAGNIYDFNMTAHNYDTHTAVTDFNYANFLSLT